MKHLLSGFLMLTVLALALPLAAQAGNVSVTGGTNGPLCSSGGYFTPSSVSISSGDTITFNVPSNDPYSGGLQIHGFPQGNFTILPGGSHTTTALTASVSYYGTWPSSGCMKGSGSVTVNVPATPTPSASTPAKTTTTTTQTTTTKSTTPAPSPSPSKSVSPSPSVSASPSPSVEPSGSPSPSPAPVVTNKPKSGSSLVFAASTGALGIIGLLAVIFAMGSLFKRKFLKPPGAPATVLPVPPISPSTSVPPPTSSDEVNNPLT